MALKFDDVIGTLRRLAKPAYLVAIPAMYLAGTAYHQGYLDGLGVNTTLLPLGVNDTYLQAFVGTVTLLTRVIEVCESHGIVSVAMLVVLVVFLTLLLHKRDVPLVQADLQEEVRLVDTAGTPLRDRFQKRALEHRRPLSDVLDSFFVVGASTYFFLLAIAVFLLFCVLFVAPYFYVGKAEAVKDLGNKFDRQSTVSLATDETGVQLYSLVECGQEFCVVYSTSAGVVSVPKSAVKWVNAAKPRS
ncbi:hypothetical protein ACFWZ1_12505 [Frateuria sp. GZRe14]|uniref:hypothetical protein n=1 Tax=Frateuria sp. GZRe14 TaxID=3351534 RepID=UPI003EDC3F24